MYGNLRRKPTQAQWRAYWVISAGIFLGLLLLKLALPQKAAETFNTRPENVLNISENLGFRILKESPSSPQGSTVIAAVAVPEGVDCTHSVAYWGENTGRWPTDNLLVGQFTFTKADTLRIFLEDTQDLATLVQRQFLAAALNQLSGADPSGVDDSMREASAWIDAHPPLIDLDADEVQEGEMLAKSLEDYNLGLAGPGLCPDDLPLAELISTPTQVATESAPELKISSLPIVKADAPPTPQKKRVQQSGARPQADLPEADESDTSALQPSPTSNPPVANAPSSVPQSQPVPVDDQPQPTSAAPPAAQPVDAPAPAEDPADKPKPEHPAPPPPSNPPPPQPGDPGGGDTGNPPADPGGGSGGGNSGNPGNGNGGGNAGDPGNGNGGDPGNGNGGGNGGDPGNGNPGNGNGGDPGNGNGGGNPGDPGNGNGGGPPGDPGNGNGGGNGGNPGNGNGGGNGGDPGNGNGGGNGGGNPGNGNGGGNGGGKP